MTYRVFNVSAFACRSDTAVLASAGADGIRRAARRDLDGSRVGTRGPGLLRRRAPPGPASPTRNAGRHQVLVSLYSI